jgi:archaetidylinositol phosphate synthase
MIDSFARHQVQSVFFHPAASLLVRFGISHHYVTTAALLIGIAIAQLLAFGFTWVAAAFLLFSGYLDAIDGTMARLSGRESAIGAVFDIVSDRAVEAAIIIGLYLVDPSVRAIYCLLMLVSVLLCITSFLVVGVFTQNSGIKSFHYSPGLMERSEAFLFFGLMMLFPTYFDVLSGVFISLVVFTALYRVWEFNRSQMI